LDKLIVVGFQPAARRRQAVEAQANPARRLGQLAVSPDIPGVADEKQDKADNETKGGRVKNGLRRQLVQ
jgi:hypothetical protein